MTVQLTVGRKFRGQFDSLAAAQAKFCELRDAVMNAGGGSRDLPDGKAIENGKAYRISWNGRLWDGGTLVANPPCSTPQAPAYMTAAITTAAEAEAFIRALHADGKLYHFDDSPETVVNATTGAKTFTLAECRAVRARAEEIFAFDGFDPFELAIELSE